MNEKIRFKNKDNINRREFFGVAASLAGVAMLSKSIEAQEEIDPDAAYDADEGITYEVFTEKFNEEFSIEYGYHIIDPVIKISVDGLSFVFKVQVTPLDLPQPFEVSLIGADEYYASETHAITYAQFSQLLLGSIKTISSRDNLR
jgi:hypothetical protein